MHDGFKLVHSDDRRALTALAAALHAHQRNRVPIQYEVGAAIVKYLKGVRPACSCRHLFVTSYAPFRRIDPTALRPMLSRKLEALNIRSEHRGPHALRHACATQLLHRGFSLRDIADFLGHRGISSVGIYAKHDMRSLRQVAAFRMASVR